MGHVDGQCTLVNVKMNLYDCYATYRLASGNITVQGPLAVPGPASIVPLTGGTGAYANVHGHARVQALSQTLTDHVLTLTP